MGPEKRLPLALLLCFIVLVVLQMRSAPDEPNVSTVTDGGALLSDVAGALADGLPGDLDPGEASMDSPDATVNPDATDPESLVAAAAAAQPESEIGPEPWAEWIEMGTAGERGHMHVLFSNFGGSVAEIRLNKYAVRQGLTDEERAERDNMVPLVLPTIERDRTLQTLMLRQHAAADALFARNVETANWEHELSEDGVTFTHRDSSGIVLTKRITKVPGQYHLNVTLSVANTNEAHSAKNLSFGLVASVGMPEDGKDSFYQQPKAVAATTTGSLVQKSPDYSMDSLRGGLVSNSIGYFGTHNKYFAVLLRPGNDPTRSIVRDTSYERVFDMEWSAGKDLETQQDEGFRDILVEGNIDLLVPAPGATSPQYDFVLFAGPKDPGQFADADEPFEEIIQEDLGFFDGIAGIILGFLRFLHGIVGNWGVAIILLTLTVRMMLFPLNRRMQTSMARHATKMKRVQPKIDALKKKYEDDPKRQREEQAKLFQTEKVMPPLGGCLPLFLQIPIFFGLFSALRVAFDLRQEPFMGWIKDLSQPDRLAEINLNTHLPFIGEIQYFNLLPILMVILWVGQQRVMPKPPADNEQARQMQKIMMWMPIMFGFFLYNYAAGLSLYMITTSAFGILESTVIRKIWPIDDKEQPHKPSRFMKKLEDLQKQAMQAQEQQRRQQGKGGGGSKKGKRR